MSVELNIKANFNYILIAGFLVAVIRVASAWQQMTSDTLPECALGQDVLVKLRIDELHRHTPAHLHGRFVVLGDLKGGCPDVLGRALRLSWRNNEYELAAGDIVVATVRLKALWGTLNVGGFDYEKWLRASGYSATGYVKHGHLASPQNTQDLSRWVRAVFETAGVVEQGALLALALGDAGLVPPEDWARLRVTGTIHLFVVSGLHVGLIGGWLYLLCLACLRLYGMLANTQVRAHRGAAVLALVGIGIYAWISGLQPPIVRAALMAGAVVLAALNQRRSVPLRVLLLTFFVAVAFQPLAVFKQGLWLSYIAVASLCWGVVGYRRPTGKILAFVRVQVVLFVLMAPALSVIVGAIPLLSIPANLFAVPAITLVALPSLMVGLLLAPIASYASGAMLMLADLSVITTKALLDSLISLVPPHGQSLGYLSRPTALVAGLAGLAFCLPLSKTYRGIAVLGLSCLLLVNQTGVRFGQVRLQVLDVGQGSAAILDTRTRRVVVDAGPKFENRFDAGQSIVIPALRSTGADKVDLLMLTHMDNDHAGGRSALMERYPDAAQMFGADACEHKKSWLWDGVRFTILQHKNGASRNDRSCTLLVESDAPYSGASYGVYMSGDVSNAAEDILVSWLPKNLTLLVTPHHGSRSSSSSVFVRHLAPKWAVHSAGRGNRYGHPHDIVMQRYGLENSSQVITGYAGGVTWDSLMPGHLLTQRDHWLTEYQ